MPTLPDYEALLAKMVQTPDSIPQVLLELRDALKTDITALESATQRIGEQDTKIRDLQDVNAKLFLAQAAVPPAQEVPEEVSPADAFDTMVNEMFGGTPSE